ncbi:RNA polymerase subunit sigma [Falsiroseomonas bella]|uniref:RNA polymerase subunit sigma n=1 Tax=Falsiroseomonas bella TaxID=2184016 RepID=A0A317FAX3_9PROT|nr:sigma-70 family RNA polymerase sigma factor [Falsiroseomonas bella]PWS35642.1 RNA polymerase subunit sigma [Falsiroseomonas bella]
MLDAALRSSAAGFLLVRAERASDAADRDARDARWSELMAAAQAGNARAYDMLLRECLPLLRAICRARLRDPADVEDAVQDALLTIHRVRHTYDPSRPFRPWLAAIAERRALDRGRSRGRSAAREVEIEAAGEVAAPGRDAEAEVALRMQAAHLRDAVGELPTAQRTALGLTKIEDLSLAEASGRSGMSVGALKVATHRALRSLRRRFGVEE